MARIQLMGGSDSGVADFSVVGAVVTVNGVSIDCAAREADDEQHIEIRQTKGGTIKEGTTGVYVAVIIVPARRYTEVLVEEESMGEVRQVPKQVPVALDPNAVIVKLWPYAPQPAVAAV